MVLNAMILHLKGLRSLRVFIVIILNSRRSDKTFSANSMRKKLHPDGNRIEMWERKDNDEAV